MEAKGRQTEIIDDVAAMMMAQQHNQQLQRKKGKVHKAVGKQSTAGPHKAGIAPKHAAPLAKSQPKAPQQAKAPQKPKAPAVEQPAYYEADGLRIPLLQKSGKKKTGARTSKGLMKLNQDALLAIVEEYAGKTKRHAFADWRKKDIADWIQEKETIALGASVTQRKAGDAGNHNVAQATGQERIDRIEEQLKLFSNVTTVQGTKRKAEEPPVNASPPANKKPAPVRMTQIHQKAAHTANGMAKPKVTTPVSSPQQHRASPLKPADPKVTTPVRKHFSTDSLVRTPVKAATPKATIPVKRHFPATSPVRSSRLKTASAMKTQEVPREPSLSPETDGDEQEMLKQAGKYFETVEPYTHEPTNVIKGMVPWRNTATHELKQHPLIDLYNLQPQDDYAHTVCVDLPERKEKVIITATSLTTVHETRMSTAPLPKSSQKDQQTPYLKPGVHGWDYELHKWAWAGDPDLVTGVGHQIEPEDQALVDSDERYRKSFKAKYPGTLGNQWPCGCQKPWDDEDSEEEGEGFEAALRKGGRASLQQFEVYKQNVASRK